MYFLIFLAELVSLFLLSKSLIKELFTFLFMVFRRRSLAVRFFAFLFLPGTIIHEFSHQFCAYLLSVPVGDVDLGPVAEDRSIRLGSVPIGETDPFRRFIIGAAPFVFGILAIFLVIIMFERFAGGQIKWMLLSIYFIFIVGNSMFSSKKDMEGAVELLIAIGGVLSLLHFFDLVSFQAVFIFFQSLPVEEVFRKGSRMLFTPVVLDVLAIAALKVLSFILSVRKT